MSRAALALALAACAGRAEASQDAAPGPEPVTRRAEGPAPTAFVGVDVIPMDGEEAVLADRTVLVKDGRIASILPAATARLPADVRLVDGEGRYLIPGLFDMHAHLLSDDRVADELAPHELAVMLANGVTSARLMIGRPLHLELRERTARGELAGPLLAVASPQLAGRSFGRFFHGRVADSPEAAHDAVRAFAAAGYDMVKLTFWIERPVYDAIVEAAREVGLPLVGHVGPRVGLGPAIAAGQQIEHLDQYLEALFPADVPRRHGVSGVGVWRPENWASLERVEAARIPELARRLAAAGIWSTPTNAFLNSSFGTGRSDEELRASPEWEFVSDEVRDELLRGRRAFWEDPPRAELRERYVSLRNALVLALHEAGAGLMAGSDAPEWLLLYGFTLPRELESLAAAGLTPHDVLATATRNPATWLGVLDERGTVERGKRADLVLLAANPLEDPGNVRAIEGVMTGGRWYPRAELDLLLDEAAAALSRAPLKQP